MLFLVVACRADTLTSLTFGFDASNTFAVTTSGQVLPTFNTTPFPTPPDVVTYDGTQWVSAISNEPFAIEGNFFIPLNAEIVSAAILFKTNDVPGAEVFINGVPIPDITFSEIRDVKTDVQLGLNNFSTEFAINNASDVGFNVVVTLDTEPSTTPEPATLLMGLFGLIMLYVGINYRKRYNLTDGL